MITKQPKVLVLTGDGINCDQETAEAFRLAGFRPDVRHLNDVIAEKLNLDQLSSTFAALALPGGFSFGDDLTSGKVLALKLKHGLAWDLRKYAARGGLVLGICNGFQALIKLGIFGKEVSITMNRQGHFIDRWVRTQTRSSNDNSACLWLKGIEQMDLPMRHGEGRILFEDGAAPNACLFYSKDVNGSRDQIAGLTDETGRIFGLMPHPEAFVRWSAHPEWTAEPERMSDPGAGLQIFENAYQAVSV